MQLEHVPAETTCSTLDELEHVGPAADLQEAILMPTGLDGVITGEDGLRVTILPSLAATRVFETPGIQSWL